MRHWLHALRRRSQRDRIELGMNARAVRTLAPNARILHLWPIERFRVRTQGKSPVRSQRPLGAGRGAAR